MQVRLLKSSSPVNKNSTIFNSKFYKLKHLWKVNADLCVWQIQQFNIHISKFLSNIKFSSLGERWPGWKGIITVFSLLAQASRPLLQEIAPVSTTLYQQYGYVLSQRVQFFEPFPLQNGNRLKSGLVFKGTARAYRGVSFKLQVIKGG